MDNSYYFMHIGALIGAGPLLWLWGWTTLSCYFPFLLSAKYYYVVKKPILSKILISKQLNRSSKSKTRIEDRNKLPIIGLIYYIIGAVLLIMFWVSDFCAIIEATVNEPSSVVQSLAFLTPYSIIGMLLLYMVSALFYWIDYGVGKHLNSKRKGNG